MIPAAGLIHSLSRGTMTRRSPIPAGPFLAGAILAACLGQVAAADVPEDPAAGFGFADVQAQAEALAALPFRAVVQAERPHVLDSLDYDQYQAIEYRRERTLWAEAGSRMRLQLFPTAFLYGQPVEVSVVREGIAHRLQPTGDWFHWGPLAGRIDDDAPIPVAGFRVLYPLHEPDHHDEIASFLGASYFRILGREQVHGLSGRGLAIDTALPGGEEFPTFRAFWLEQPHPEDRSLQFYGLLDSPSVAGAYRFVLQPGTRTQMEVEAVLYPRADVASPGIAPLTSMFLAGSTTPPPADDFRPHVHDSDGLLILNGNGERVWRPLVNPRALAVSAFSATSPAGYGLLQRNQDFHAFQDLEALYHRRPGPWVEPLEDWGEGSVHLVEIPTSGEYFDNVVAYWAPAQPMKAGVPFSLRYRVLAVSGDAGLSPEGRVVATRLGRPPEAPGLHRLLIDFSGGELDVLRPVQPVEADAAATNGRIVSKSVVGGLPGGNWRLVLHVEPTGSEPVDLRARLMLHDQALTETWLFTLPP